MSRPSPSPSSTLVRFIALAAAALSFACVPPEWSGPSAPTDGGQVGTLPEAELAAIADGLRERSGAPGAILGVHRGDARWVGASGHEDLLGVVPLRGDRVFRAASITKTFTAALVLQAAEQGLLSLDDTLDAHVPGFAQGDTIRLEQLLAHEAGVTSAWFGESGALADEVLGDLGRTWNLPEVLALIAEQPPAGPPGQQFAYSNAGYVLLGAVLERVHGRPLAATLAADLGGPLGLYRTEMAFQRVPDLASGYYELAGVPLDASVLPQSSLLSFARAAGALHTTADDLLSFGRALFADAAVLEAQSLDRMVEYAGASGDHGLGLMRFCPCADGVFSGYGHAGNLPGYWSVFVHYPEADLTVVAMINRDVVEGIPVQRSVFDPTLTALLDTLSP